MRLFVASLFSIPVSYAQLFEGKDIKAATVINHALILAGDPKMPPTFVPTWPAWANVIRNAFLALVVWKTYSVLDVGYWPKIGDWVYLAYGEDGKVIPRPIDTRFIMVKHGREVRRLTIFNRKGRCIPFTLRGRGTRMEVIGEAYLTLQELEEELSVIDPDFVPEAIPPEALYTFI